MSDKWRRTVTAIAVLGLSSIAATRVAADPAPPAQAPIEVGTPTPAPVNQVVRPGPGGFVPITPFRVLDTRVTPDQSVRRYNGAPPVRAGEQRALTIALPTDQSLPPGGAGGVTLTLTVVDQAGSGWISAWPANEPWPGTSNLNFVPGKVISNTVTVRLSPDGQIRIMANTAVNVIVDVNGWYAQTGGVASAGGGFWGIRPARLFDSRSMGGRLGSGDLRFPQVPLPAELASVGARAVVLNVTAVNTQAPGFISILPAGVWPPPVSHINYQPGQTVANEVILDVSGSAQFTVYATGSTDVIIDVMGYFTGGANVPGGYVPLAGGPARHMDTRTGCCDYVYSAPHDARLLVIGGRRNVPAYAGAVAINVTAVQPFASGYVRVWPDSAATPGVSHLSVQAGSISAVGLSTGLGPQRGVLIGSNAYPNILVDVAGWYSSTLV